MIRWDASVPAARRSLWDGPLWQRTFLVSVSFYSNMSPCFLEKNIFFPEAFLSCSDMFFLFSDGFSEMSFGYFWGASYFLEKKTRSYSLNRHGDRSDRWNFLDPSGYDKHSYGKSPCFMGFQWISVNHLYSTRQNYGKKTFQFTGAACLW